MIKATSERVPSIRKFSACASGKCALLVVLMLAGCQSMATSPQGLPGPDGMTKPVVVRGQNPMAPNPAQNRKKPKNDGGLFEQWRRWTLPKQEEKAAKDILREADTLFEEKKFADARSKYKEAANKWVDSGVEEDALFMIAETYFFEDKYPDASDAYSVLLKRYSNTRHLDMVTRRYFAIGKYWQQIQQAKPRMSLNPNFTDKTRPWFDTGGNALASYETIWMNDPTGPLADESIVQIATAHFLDNKFEAADEYFSQLRRDYPNSQHLVEAYLLGFRAKLETYQGNFYDPTALQEAEKLLETLLKQFPHELRPEDRERLLQARQAVRAMKADREWNMAEYYHKNKYYRAARQYYENIIKEYPQSKFADLAQKRMDETENLPPVPPYKFKWLDYVLPRNDKGPLPIAGEEGEPLQ